MSEDGLYRGDAYSVELYHNAGVLGRSGGFAVTCVGRTIIGVFQSKEVANGIAATFDALTPEGFAPESAPIDSLLELVGFRQILAEVVGREAKRLQAEELATRAAANRLRGRSWP
jgi:hypothetical protein